MNTDSQSSALWRDQDSISFNAQMMRHRSAPPKFAGLNSRSPDDEARRIKVIYFAIGSIVGMAFMAIIAFASGSFEGNVENQSSTGNVGSTSTAPTLFPIGITAAPTATNALVPTATPTTTAANFAAAAPGGSVVAVPAGRVGLISCPDNQLCVLVRESDSQIVARSYDGNNWESSAISGTSVPLLKFDCLSNQACTVVIPGEGSFHLAAYARSTSSVQETSRFLTQASFGATRKSITEWPGSAKAWISSQMTKAASLHRSYYRERVNTRTTAINPAGRARLACESGSRWRGFAFTVEDIGKTIVATDAGATVSLAIDGVARTEVPTADWNVAASLAPFTVCTVKENVGGAMTMGTECAGVATNPTVALSTAPPATNLVSLTNAATLLVSLDLDIPNVKLLKLDSSTPSQCTAPENSVDNMLFVQTAGTNYMIHDARIVLEDNTMSSPMVLRADSPGPSVCANVVKSFVNIQSCVIQRGEACEPLRTPTAIFTLDSSIIIDMYALANGYVYSVTGLKLDADDLAESPCSRTKSRWVKSEGTCGATSSNNKLSAATTATLVDLLVNSQDNNPLMRDIVLPYGAVCDVTKISIGARLDVNDPIDGAICWQHVHSDLDNVFDFSYWAQESSHPGNKVASASGRPNPIKSPATEGGTDTVKSTLVFPSNHPMARWAENRKYFTFIGRLNDVIEFSTLPTNLQSVELATKVGAVVEAGVEADQVYGEICGSPGEVANNPAHGSRFAILQTNEDDVKIAEGRLDQTISPYRVKSTVWNMVAMYGKDQLRQRVAWALSQILVVTAEEVDEEDTSEHFLKYYDIFVRHAFRNYRDVLKEVSFSPMMGEMLSYMGSVAFAYQDREIFPDENYAREIMQLFSVGLWKLNNDGTPVLDDKGLPIATYNNDEIMTFARAWTGFSKQPLRGNVETPYGTDSPNKIDPMRLEGHKRDAFPKRDLHGGYIGDQAPLCVDGPARRFLRKGATYRFIGSSPLPREQRDPTSFGNTAGGIKRVELVAGQSALYAALCNASPSDPDVCRYQSEVVLDSNLECQGQECEVDTVRVVALSVTGTVFFEYIRPPCVQLAFFNGGKKLSTINTASSTGSLTMCADPRMAIGGEACCSTAASTAAEQNCSYHGERMTFTTAKGRCASKTDGAQSVCDFTSVAQNCAQNPFFSNMWTSADCAVQAKVSKDGRVALVHDTPVANTRAFVLPTTKNFFRVLWADDKLVPLAGTDSCGAGCTAIVGDEAESCLCAATVVERAVFSSKPSREDILKLLHIGAAAPSVHDSNMYSTTAATNSAEGVKTYVHTGGEVFDIDTIFELTVNSKIVFLRNMESEVQLSGGARFRNPPHFMDLVDATTRDALHETDAVLDNYMYHPNTAPFLAYRFIQRFVSSNPSPRYIDTVATAFRTGTYDGFGSGEYGDLAATISAVLLDREARSTELDLEPSNGKLREPLLKVIQFMRSMELELRDRHELELGWMEDMIGMNAHQAPNVFSFFQPEFAPSGPIQNAALVSPESQVLTSPNIMSFLNGMSSMAKYDLTDCAYGFAQNYEEGRCDIPTINLGTKAIANLKFAPNAGATAVEIVNELDLLLTTGRLDPKARELMVEEYTASLAESGSVATALRHLYQLFAVTPEFHTTNINTRTNTVRPLPPPPSSTLPAASAPYKAIVYLFLAGAADSFNILVPHSECAAKDLNAEYSTIRGDAALDKSELLGIAVPVGTQPCNVFGLHPKLSKLKQSYDQGQVSFLANVGPLVEPVTKATWDSKEAKLPKSLFAHNVQQRTVQSVQPDGAVGTGVLGRIADQLTEQGYSMGSYSVTGNSHALLGRAPQASPPQDIIDSLGGVLPFDEYPSSARILPAVYNLTGSTTSLFGETWSATVQNMLGRTKELGEALKNAEVAEFPKTGLGIQFEQVAKLIKAHGNLGTNRDVFHVSLGGFDTHTNLQNTLTLKMEQIDAALEAFKNEMVAQGVWDDVIVVTASDFGRTLTSNGAGTDHAWGGNYWMMGGKVNGARIHGEFPDDLTSNGPLNIGRGRLIPTMSWEGVWNGITKWFGVAAEGMAKVLPNIGNFPVESLLTSEELFV